MKKTIVGAYLAKVTGELLEDENDLTYIEVIVNGKSVFAKPAMPYGWYAVPSKEWLEANEGKWGAWVMFENGNPAHPVWFGMCPLDEQSPEDESYPRIWKLATEEYTILIDDANKEYIIKGPNDNEVRILANEATLKGYGTINLGNDSGTEPAVLGDKNASVLNSIITEMITICGHVITFAGAQATVCGSLPIYAPLIPAYTALAGSLGSSIGSLSALAAEVITTKSLTVNLV